MAQHDEKVLRLVANGMLNAIEIYRGRFDNEEGIQLAMFLRVMLKPGISMKELEKVMGMSKSAISRTKDVLSSEGYQRDKVTGLKVPGHGLVMEASDPLDARAKVLSPTKKGRMHYEKMMAALVGRKVG